MITKESFLSILSQTSAVELPNGTAYVRQLTVDDRLRLERLIEANKDKPIHSVVLALTLSDESGQPLFTEDDIPALGKLPAPVADRLLKAATTLNAIGESAIDDAAKN